MKLPSARSIDTLIDEIFTFAALLFLMFVVGCALCPYIPGDVLSREAPLFRTVTMMGFFLGIPFAWMLCCLALRPARQRAYFLSLSIYIGLSYVYGYMMAMCNCWRLFELTDAYLLLCVFPMFHHLLLVPLMLLLNAWLCFGKLPVAPMTARRFGRHGLVALAVLWSLAMLTSLLPVL